MKRPPPRAARALAVAFVLTTAGLLAAGCGGASMSGGAQEPSSAKSGDVAAMEPLPPPPTTVDEALTQLQTAELDINNSLPGAAPQQYAQPPGQSPAQPGVPQAPAATAQAPAPPPPPTRAEAKKAEAAGAAADAEHVTTTAPDPCTTACRALASMGRAADHLCDLAGAEDARCGNARERLQIAEGRVRQSCPHCAR